MALRAVSATLTFRAFILKIEVCTLMVVYQMLRKQTLYSWNSSCFLRALFTFFSKIIPPFPQLTQHVAFQKS